MEYRILGSLEEIGAEAWNALVHADNPFARHEFLVAMERHGAVGARFGWYPQYLVAHRDGALVGAVPMYLKDNSYGELVFDWAWADACHRRGKDYYPKLVVAIPYTPVTGQRVLARDDEHHESISRGLIDAALAHARQLGVSSLHWLFTDEFDTGQFGQHRDFMLRLGCQFHWHNRGYADFDDYLATFTSAKRKKIRQERRRVREQAIELEVLHGDEVSEAQWDLFHRFYTDTFDRKSGYPTFSKAFFMEIARTLPRQVVLVLARHEGQYVAGAFNMRGSQSLYGRHWGCSAEFHSLHFEACYYQGLDYCIEHGLERFEPGAQGEHKIARGFLPSRTWSAHWIADAPLSQAVGQFLDHETAGMQDYIDELAEHSPFRK